MAHSHAQDQKRGGIRKTEVSRVGSLVFVLNGHIPYCKKSGVWPFGEEWVFEAIADTYIPLLDVITGLEEKGIAANLTISISPVLLEQLRDSYMISRFEEYLREKI
ncbi:MAG TPA: hypothetical protein GX506_05920, partial [Firmicutes bacterium]|nr:hypothetical protein [Bacillota bacterium]